MQIKFPELLSIEVKGQRGLSYQAQLFEARPYIFEISGKILPKGVPLKSGEPTAVSVILQDLPVNADIKRIFAELEIIDDQTVETSQETKVTVKGDEDKKPRTYEVGVGVKAGLQNVELKLEQGEVFWRQAGTLKPGKYDIPDFAEQANAYLDKAKPVEGKVNFQFVIKSDTAGRVRITIRDHDFSLLQTQAWKNELDDTFRVDRNLQLNFNQIENLPVDSIEIPPSRKLQLSTIKMEIGGQFGPERLLSSVEKHDGKEFIVVSQDYSLAQCFRLEKELIKTPLRCVGVNAYFEADEEAELYVEIQPDANQVPSMDMPLVKANLAFTPAEKKEEQSWTFIQFESPTELQVDIPYWIVVKGVRGKIKLALQNAIETTDTISPMLRERIMVHRGGQIWKNVVGRYSSNIINNISRNQSVTQALFGLIYLPEIDNQMAAVQIAIQGTPITQRFNLGPEARTVSFDLDSIEITQAVFVIYSYAKGTLSLANVIQDYKLT